MKLKSSMFSCFPFKKKKREKKEEDSELLRMVGELKGEQESKVAEAQEESEALCGTQNMTESVERQRKGEMSEAMRAARKKLCEALGGDWKKERSEAVIESKTNSEAAVESEKMSRAGVEGEKMSETLKGGSKKLEKPTKDDMNAVQAYLASRRRFVRPDSATSVSESEETSESHKKTKDGMNSVQACLAAHRRFVRQDSATSVSKPEETDGDHKKTEKTKDGKSALQACLAARRRFVRPDSATSVSELEEDSADEMMGAQENDGPGPSGGKKKLLTSSLAPQFRRKNLPRKKTEKEDRDAD